MSKINSLISLLYDELFFWNQKSRKTMHVLISDYINILQNLKNGSINKNKLDAEGIKRCFRNTNGRVYVTTNENRESFKNFRSDF